MKNNNSKVIKAIALMALVWGHIAQPMFGRGRFGRLAIRRADDRLPAVMVLAM